MASKDPNCAFAEECCPPTIWQGPPPGITPQLTGMVWTIPCNGIVPNSGGASCFCVNPADSVSTLVGDPSELYDVTFLIRGVFEFAKYTGGVILPGTGNAAISGGTPVLDGHNQYALIISNPSQTIYLNGWDGNGATYGLLHALRYTVLISVNGGATVILRANNGGDGMQAQNFNNLVLALTPGDPPFNPVVLPQPFQTPGLNPGGEGQWMQADSILIL